MAKPPIQVTIINDSRFKVCDIECGIDWSDAESVTLAKQGIKKRFGDRAQLEYIDLPQAADSHQIVELKQRIKELALPALLINGHPRIFGQFDIRRLLDVIEAEMEMAN